MNSVSLTPLCGIILAGGRSTRMGRDKAAIVHPDGRTLARRCYDLLLEAGCGLIAISLRQGQEIPPDLADLESLRVVRDPEGESLGPMVGILTGMSLRPDADWLVVACDLPRLDFQTLSHLTGSVDPSDKFVAYRSEFDGLPEPLCTLYTRDSFQILKQAQADDFLCPRKVLIRNDCRLLDPVSPRALDNANTPKDWETAMTP